MAPRRQSMRGKRDVEMTEGPMGSSKRMKVEEEAGTSDFVEQDSKAGLDLTLGDTSPMDTKIRTTRTLRGVKNQLKTPEEKKGFTSGKESESDGKDVTDHETAKKVSKSEKKKSMGEEEANETAEDLTDFEKERRETMARNEAMLLALGVQEAAQGFDASMHAKRARAAAKGLQTVRAKKEKKEPVVVRRSSRIQNIAPEGPTAGGIDRENRDGSVLLHGQEAPLPGSKSVMPAPWEEKRRIQGPVKFESTNTDDHSSDAAFLDTLRRLRDDQPLKRKTPKLPTADPGGLKLKERDVARVVKERIFAMAFFPTVEKVIAAAGDKSGGLGVWDVDAENENDGVHVFTIGPRPISGMAVSKRDCTKLYTCSFDGCLRVLDVEKGVFDEAFVAETSDFSALSLGPIDGGHVAYVGDGDGALTVVDLRAATAKVTYQMHGRKINTIDFNPHRSHIFATGGTDAMAYVWDVRKLPAETSKKAIHPLASLAHVKGVNSIYFSPDGEKLASTSYDNYIRVYDDMLNVLDAGDSTVAPSQPLLINHNNNTGRWISPFRAVWTWDSRHVAVGSMNRAIDLIDVENKNLTRLASGHMPTIPARVAVHPLLPIIAGGVAGGKLHIWR